MSILTKHLQMHATGERKPLPLPMFSMKASSDFDPIKNMMHFAIEAKFREEVWAREEDKDFIYKRVVHDMNKAVYGDVEDCLRRIDRALYEYDVLAARDALQQAFEAVRP